MDFLSTTIDVQRSDIVQRLKRCPESTVSMTAHGAKLRTNCGNPNWLCLLHRSKTHIHETNFYCKTVRQPVVRLFAPYEPSSREKAMNSLPFNDIGTGHLFLRPFFIFCLSKVVVDQLIGIADWIEPSPIP